MPTHHMHSSRTRLVACLGLVAIPLLFAAEPAGAQQPVTGQPAAGRTPLEDTYYAAGQWVDVPAPVFGDVVVAGRTVTMRHAVSGDVLAAGWRVTLTGTADDDVRIAGNDVRVDAPVAGDLTLAGQTVTVGAGSHVTGRAWIAGQIVRVEGTFDRELRIAGAAVQVGGEVRQPMTVIADRLEVLPGARILSPLTYKGRSEARIAPRALLVHPIAYERLPEPSGSSRVPASVLFAMHLLAAGALLLWMAPRIAAAPAGILGAQTARSLLLGVALFVTVPLTAMLLLITLIGIPIALTVAALYFVALFLGLLTTALYVGNVEARLFHQRPMTGPRRQAVWFAAGVVTLAVLRSVPLLGSVVVFVAILSGLGALGLWSYRACAARTVAAPAL